MAQHHVHCLWSSPQVARGFQTAVSLHSHTDRSREGMSCIPRYAEANPLLGLAVSRLSARYRRSVGKELDYGRSYFVPPLDPAAAFEVEARQIEALGLMPVVSLTDHDTISGILHLRSSVDVESAPISLEWTAPFGAGCFHIGVHNLPSQWPSEIVFGLLEVQCDHCQASGLACTRRHGPQCLSYVGEWLERLSAIPDALVVLNHPLWDTQGLGDEAHRQLLVTFLKRYRPYIHALELNGLRSWQENHDIIAICDRWSLPIVSGGDRHGCEPNANLNLTNARNFSGFARELRAGEPSVVLFMPQYRQPLHFRKIRAAWDVLKTSTATNGRQAPWTDRIWMPWIDGRVLALSSEEWSTTLAHKPVVRPQTA